MNKTPKEGENAKAGPSKHTKKPARRPGDRDTACLSSDADFDQVLGLIDAAKTRARAAVNTTHIDLYWAIGEYIHKKIADDGWGAGTVAALAGAIRRHYPSLSGYSARNLCRMSQFFETYRDLSKLAPLVRHVVLDPEPAHHEPLQARGRTRVLPAALPPREVG